VILAALYEAFEIKGKSYFEKLPNLAKIYNDFHQHDKSDFSKALNEIPDNNLCCDKYKNLFSQPNKDLTSNLLKISESILNYLLKTVKIPNSEFLKNDENNIIFLKELAKFLNIDLIYYEISISKEKPSDYSYMKITNCQSDPNFELNFVVEFTPVSGNENSEIKKLGILYKKDACFNNEFQKIIDNIENYKKNPVELSKIELKLLEIFPEKTLEIGKIGDLIKNYLSNKICEEKNNEEIKKPEITKEQENKLKTIYSADTHDVEDSEKKEGVTKEYLDDNSKINTNENEKKADPHACIFWSKGTYNICEGKNANVINNNCKHPMCQKCLEKYFYIE